MKTETAKMAVFCAVLRPYARNDYDDGSSVRNGSGSV